MRRPSRHNAKQRRNIILLVLFVIICLASFPFIFASSEEDVLNDQLQRYVPKKRLESEWIISPQVYVDRSTSIHERRRTLKGEEDRIQARCDQYTQQQQVLYHFVSICLFFINLCNLVIRY